MRILITGGRGFAGRHLAAWCLQQPDSEVWSLDHPRPGPVGPPLPTRLRPCTADILDEAAVEQVVKEVQPDAIYHLAARTSVGAGVANPVGVLQTNIVGQLYVLQAVRAAGNHARVLNIGSAKEYGATSPHTQQVDESVSLQPVDLYGVSKVAQDVLGYHFFAAYQSHVVRVRPFNHTGPGQSDAFVASSFSRQLAEIKLGLRAARIEVGDLAPVVDFTDVRDMVRAYTLALEHGTPGEVYNIGSGRGVQIGHLLQSIIQVGGLESKVEVRADPRRQRSGSASRVVCDPAKFQALTGWQPTYSLEETLSDLYSYWLDRLASVAPGSH